jgi:hypothetical protein
MVPVLMLSAAVVRSRMEKRNDLRADSAGTGRVLAVLLIVKPESKQTADPGG